MIPASPAARAAADRVAALRSPPHWAAVDLGSNSFRLEIGHLHQGRYHRIDYLKETVRLGAGLDARGCLTAEATARAMACLARFAQRLQTCGAQRVRAVATQTLREARNRDAFLDSARRVLGVPIDVISGREEALLIYAGVARLQPSDQPRLVVDIGGRSTELIVGCGRQVLCAESFEVGSVGLSLDCFGDGCFTEAGFRAAGERVAAQFAKAREMFAPRRWVEALGASGTVDAASRLLAASGVSDGRITAAGLRWAMAQCLRAGHVSRLDLPGLKDDQRPILAAGLSILHTLALEFGIDTLVPAQGALRHGVIVALAEA